ncbi:hypothetical protein LguiB_022276 [Lonicera macranthoides]
MTYCRTGYKSHQMNLHHKQISGPQFCLKDPLIPCFSLSSFQTIQLAAISPYSWLVSRYRGLKIATTSQNLCQRQSQTFSGRCGSSVKCEKICKRKEHASTGACHGGVTCKMEECIEDMAEVKAHGNEE